MATVSRRSSGDESVRVRWSVLGVACLVLALLWPGSAVAATGELAVTFVAFGQGDAAVYRGPCGEVGVIDAGAGSVEEVLAVLDAAGGRRLRWLSASHYDADHIGDLVDLASAPGVSVDTVYDRGGDRAAKDSDTYRAYYDWATTSGGRVTVDIGSVFALCAGTPDEVVFTVVSAGSDGTAAGGVAVSEENDRGVCVHVGYRDFDLASCGDVNGSDEGARADVESAVAPVYGDVEVAKVNHHGSAWSSNPSYVATLAAQAAVIMVGDNSFGHPDPAVVARWDAAGDVYQTLTGQGSPADGNVTVTSPGSGSFRVVAAGSGRAGDYLTDEAAQAPAPAGFDGDPATTERVDAPDPTAAAVAVSRGRFGDGAAGWAVLSRDDEFADSLAGSPLTAGGPLLLTPSAALASATRGEIRRALPAGGRVYLLGGPAALSPAVGDQLAADGYQVVRLAGPSRVETAVRVADEVRALHPASSWVALARAHGPPDNPTAGWADSVTGGGWAAAFPNPVLVTPSDALHPAVADALARYQPQRTVLLGGTAALSTTVEQQVPNPLRFAGSERAGTAAAIATGLWPSGADRFVIINGYRLDGWAYGLPAAGLAAAHGAPLLLADTDRAPAATLEVASTPCDTPPAVDLVLIGSASVLSAQVQQQLDNADGGACPPPPPPPDCDPAYPDFCVPPPPPDLDCGDPEIGGRTDFTVLAPDPHGFDGDGDGIGCES